MPRLTGRARPATTRGSGRALIAIAIIVSSIAFSGAAPAYATNDFYWPEQWAPEQIGAPDAWGLTTGTGVRIGVVDTGVDLEHEDLAGKVVASTTCIGTDGRAASCRGSGQDDNGHGTVVSSIAAAATFNERGIAGVAPGAELVVARSLTDNGRGGAAGTAADVMAGIEWVVAQGARIVNLSLGADVVDATSGPSPLAQAIERAWARGAIPVVAAGNGTPAGSGSVYANLNAVVVGASYADGSPAPYSVSLGGAKWGLLAPGGAGGDPSSPTFMDDNVISATWVPGERSSYGVSSGTSIAAPHVSGALALLLAQGLSREQAIGRLLDAVDRSTPCGPGCRGRLDVARAVGAQGGSSPPPVAAEGDGSAPVDEAANEVTPTEVAPITRPEGFDAGSPEPEPLPVESPDGDEPEQTLALLPEPESSLRLAVSPGPDALVPRNLLLVVGPVTVVFSALLEWLARRDRRGDEP